MAAFETASKEALTEAAQNFGPGADAQDECLELRSGTAPEIVLLRYMLLVLGALVVLIAISWRRYGSLLSALLADPKRPLDVLNSDHSTESSSHQRPRNPSRAGVNSNKRD